MPDMTELSADAAPGPLEQLIFVLRGQRVLLSTHLAGLYGVEPRALAQAVKRNPERFPTDFLFQLSDAEFKLESQSVTQVGPDCGGRPEKNSAAGRQTASGVLK